MKKVYGVFLNFVVTLMSVSFVAAETNIQVFGRSAAGSIAQLLDNSKFGPTNLTSILLGILLWMIIYSLTKKTLGNGGGVWAGAVSLIITLLSIIFIPDALILAIGSEYAALGATILTVLPFILAFYFTAAVTDNQVIAKAIWAVFTIYYVAMFIFSWGLLPAGSAALPATATGTANIFGLSDESISYWAYAIFAMVSAIMFGTIGYIRKKWWEARLEGDIETSKKLSDEAIGGAIFLKDIFKGAAEGGKS